MRKFDLTNKNHLSLFNDRVDYFKQAGKTVDLAEVKKARTPTQNRALHLWFEFIANELNNMGQTFVYAGLVQDTLECEYTKDIVKHQVIKPFMKVMFDKTSTTKLETGEINKLIDAINLYFSERRGVQLPFPSIQSLKEYYKSNY